MTPFARTLALAALAGACSQPERIAKREADGANAIVAPAPARQPPAPSAAPPAGGNSAEGLALTAAGLGAIIIGKPPPPPPLLGEDDVQISETCRTLRRPGDPGLYVMTDGKVVTRITLMRASTVRTDRGIGLGASDAEIGAAYPGLIASPHEYSDAPAKNLLWRPNGKGGLRFEIDSNGKANLIHAGVSPWLEYSEGCA